MKKLFEIFKSIGLPYFRQGSMSDEDYSDEFFTFWNHGTPNDSFYDNAESRYIEHIQIGYYTNNSNLIYSQLDEGGEFYNAAKSNGFVFVDRAQDADADKPDYYGRVLFIKIINRTGA